MPFAFCTGIMFAQRFDLPSEVQRGSNACRVTPLMYIHRVARASESRIIFTKVAKMATRAKRLGRMPATSLARRRRRSHSARVDKDLAVRIGQGWTEMSKLRHIWHSQMLQSNTKITLWRTLIQPILLYGTAAYPLTEERRKKLCGATTHMLRHALNLRYDQHATLSDIYGTGLSTKVHGHTLLDIPQASTSVILRTGSLLNRTMHGPEQPLSWILHQALRKQKAVGHSHLTLLASYEREFHLSREELLQLAQGDPNVWNGQVYHAAFIHETHIYSLAAYNAQSRRLREQIRQTALQSLAGQQLCQFNLTARYNSKLQFLQQHLPAAHPIHEMELHSPPQVRGLVRRHLLLHAPATNAAFTELLQILQQMRDVDILDITTTNKTVLEIANHIGKAYLTKLLSHAKYDTLRKIASEMQCRTALHHPVIFHQATREKMHAISHTSRQQSSAKKRRKERE